MDDNALRAPLADSLGPPTAPGDRGVRLRAGTQALILGLGLLCSALAWAGGVPDAIVGPRGREPGFRGWSQVRTEHFLFVYEQRDEDAVRELLSFAEDLYGELSLFLGSAPREIQVVVRGRVDSANGYTAASPPHIVLYVAPPSEPLLGLDATSYLRLLFVHELTHFFNFQYDRGILSTGEKIFGPGVKEAEALFYGYAMMEGIATVTETMFTDGGRGRDPFFDLEPRALVRDHTFFPLARVPYGSSFPPRDRVWLGGYLFVQYLLDRFGPDVMKDLRAACADSPVLGPWEAVRKVTGRDAKDLFHDMVAGLEERWRDREAITPGRRLSPPGIGDWFLPVVTEAGWFLYRRTLGDPGAIVRWDPRSGKEQVLRTVTMPDASSLTATRDGSRVVFAALEQTVGGSGPLVLSDLFALDPATRAVHRITVGAHLWQPRLSPDGSALIAVQAVGAHTRLVAVDRATGNLTVLYSRPGARVCTPAFSPDGSRVVFAEQAGGRNDILVLPLPAAGTPIAVDERLEEVNVDSAVRLLPSATGREYYPRFIDDQTVAFSSDRDGALALYALSSPEGEPSLLCEDPVGAWAGEAFDGKIVYATWRSSGFTLMEKDPLTAAAVPRGIPAAAAGKEAPPASPEPISPMPGFRRYVDLPRFVYWAPLLIYFSSIAASELVFAPGVILGSLSNLETTSLDAAFGFRIDHLQPSVELAFQTMLGTTGLSYALSEGFTTVSSGQSRQQLQQELSFSFPLISSAVLRTTTGLTASAGVVDSIILRSPVPFDFADGLRAGQGGSAPAFEHDAGVTAGLAFVRAASGSALDLFAPNALVAATSAFFSLPSISAIGPGALAQGLVALSFPSPFPHQVVKLGVKASYQTFGEPFIQVTNPRGDFDPVIQLLPGRTLVSLDYQFPIALLDAPLLFIFGLVAIGGGVHVEAAADWGPAPAALAFDGYLYTGTELLLVIAAGEGTIPVLFGASVRFDPRFQAPFDWSTDIRPYIAISTDSFAGAGPAGRAGRTPVYIRAR
jgi:hypothetical protein